MRALKAGDGADSSAVDTADCCSWEWRNPLTFTQSEQHCDKGGGGGGNGGGERLIASCAWHVPMCVCVRACVRGTVHAYMRARVCVYVYARARAQALYFV